MKCYCYGCPCFENTSKINATRICKHEIECEAHWKSTEYYQMAKMNLIFSSDELAGMVRLFYYTLTNKNLHPVINFYLRAHIYKEFDESELDFKLSGCNEWRYFFRDLDKNKKDLIIKMCREILELVQNKED